ncbi:hypothetical protein V1511DRAFT_503322 [Dipodascopsis uninucleata]
MISRVTMSSFNPSTPTKFKPTRGSLALSKPFKSPLKRARIESSDNGVDDKATGLESCSSCSLDSVPSSAANSPMKTFNLFSSPFGKSYNDNSSVNTSPADKIGTFREKFLSPAKDERLTVDPVLVKQEMSLDMSLRQMKLKISQCQQAYKYETASVKIKDDTEVTEEDHLSALMEKWRSAAQKATEYLFGLAQERVQKMGGISEFKKRTQKRAYHDESEDQQRLDEIDNSGIDHLRDEYDYDVVLESKRSPDTFTNDIEEEFTVKMMLAFLNIDAAIVYPNES